MDKNLSTESVSLCRTCLRAKGVINEGGLLFRERCLKNYRQIMDWMNPQLDTGQTPCYRRALELRMIAQLEIGAALRGSSK